MVLVREIIAYLRRIISSADVGSFSFIRDVHTPVSGIIISELLTPSVVRYLKTREKNMFLVVYDILGLSHETIDIVATTLDMDLFVVKDGWTISKGGMFDIVIERTGAKRVHPLGAAPFYEGMEYVLEGEKPLKEIMLNICEGTPAFFTKGRRGRVRKIRIYKKLTETRLTECGERDVDLVVGFDVPLRMHIIATELSLNLLSLPLETAYQRATDRLYAYITKAFPEVPVERIKTVPRVLFNFIGRQAT